MARTTESLKAHSKPLHPLSIGARVFLQNQQGNHSTKWDRSGTVVESPGYDQYRVKVDGSERPTLCNRRFLRAYTPATPSLPQGPTAEPHLTRIGDHAPAQPPPAAVEPITADATTTDPITVDAPTPDDTTPPNRLSLVPTAPTSPAQVLTDYPCHGPPSAPETPAPDQQPCPRRSRQPPKHYEPETGQWIER